MRSGARIQLGLPERESGIAGRAVKRRMEMTLWIVCAAWLLSMNARGAESARAADDPYAALQLYDGKWLVMPSDGPKEGVRLENHCAKTGLFFACE